MKKLITLLLFSILIQWQSNAQMAECKGKFLGNIMPSSWSGPVIRSDFATYWNQVSPENAGKWGVAEGSRDNYSWSDLDQMYNFCKENGFPFKQHVFVWGSQQPNWIAGLSQAEQRAEVEEWYQDFATRYPDTDIIDVVNESLQGHAPDVDFRDALGGFNNGASNPYLSAHPEYGPYGTGWDYIIYSFAKAREYFPNSTLLLNDYNIINSTSNINSHLEIVNILKARGLIDGVGIQCHAFSVDNMSAQQITNNLNMLATAGLPIHVTELDIRGDDNNEQQQKQRYETIFPAFWEHPDVAGITLWGYVEGTTWMEFTGILNPDGSKRAAFIWLEEYMASQPDVCNSVEVELTSPTKDTMGVAPAEIFLSASVSDPDAISTLKFMVNDQQVGETEYLAPYFTTFTATEAGTYEAYAVVTMPDGSEVVSSVRTITVNVPQGPYDNAAHPIPGVIEAEEFDLGGNGFAYNDDSDGSETGVSFRDTEDVDIEECSDDGGGYNIGWFTAGEWLEYTVDVEASGPYDLDIRVACDANGRTANFEMDGVSIAFNVAIPNTGGWQAWTTVTVQNISLSEGEHILKISLGDQDYINLNYVEFRSMITGVEESLIETNIYPNPFGNSGFEIEVTGEFEYTLLSMTGTEMESGKMNKGIGQSLPSGVYLLSIKTSEGTALHRVIRK
jgi:GH35 family endo-1,4-beta-xylanase